jgi:hypothetical protein
MAKNVQINGVDYANVASIKLPLTVNTSTFAYFYDTDSGDAAATDILNGKKAWVDGAEVTGNIPAKASADMTVDGKTVTAPAGHYASDGVKSVADGSVTPNLTATGSVIGDTASSYAITLTPKATVNSAGYVSSISDGSAVTKYVQTESKNATPSGSEQTITPTAGKLLHSVVVAAVALTGNAAVGDVLSGKTFYNNSLTRQTGTLTVPSLSLAAGVLSIV